MQLYQKIALGVFAFCVVVTVTRRIQQEQDAEASKTIKQLNHREEDKPMPPPEHRYPPSLFSPEERAVIQKKEGCDDLTLWNTPWSDRRTLLIFKGGEKVVWFGIGTPDAALIRYQNIEGYIDFGCLVSEKKLESTNRSSSLDDLVAESQKEQASAIVALTPDKLVARCGNPLTDRTRKWADNSEGRFLSYTDVYGRTVTLIFSGPHDIYLRRGDAKVMDPIIQFRLDPPVYQEEYALRAAVLLPCAAKP
jgi:hypothetical protein